MNSSNSRRSRLTRLLAISGSPVKDSSTDLLIHTVTDSLVASIAEQSIQVDFVRLNDLNVLPCQACGEAPTPSYCFYDDAMTELYQKLESCDCLVIGSPIHFDTVSSQTKLFIDRCNCVRPADFHNSDAEHDFLKLLPRKRPGGMVLVGGEEGWFEGARRCLAGWFKWVEVVNEGVVSYRTRDFNTIGEVANSSAALAEAEALGLKLAAKIGHDYGRS